MLILTIFIQILGGLFGLLFTFMLAKYSLNFLLYPQGRMDGLYQYTEASGEIGFQYARIFG